MKYLVSFLVLQSSQWGRERERYGCFTLIVFCCSVDIRFLCIFLAMSWVGLYILWLLRFLVIHWLLCAMATKSVMQGMHPHNAEGPDHIPTKFLEEFAAKLPSAMTLIFQASLQQDEVPDDWTNLQKRTHRSTASNYGSISLTSVCSKILEDHIHSQSMRHLYIHWILSDPQHGFRMKPPCESQRILTVQDLVAALEENEQVNAILLGLSKAFDKISYQHRAIKLDHFVVTYSSGLKAYSPRGLGPTGRPRKTTRGGEGMANVFQYQQMWGH